MRGLRLDPPAAHLLAAPDGIHLRRINCRDSDRRRARARPKPKLDRQALTEAAVFPGNSVGLNTVPIYEVTLSADGTRHGLTPTRSSAGIGEDINYAVGRHPGLRRPMVKHRLLVPEADVAILDMIGDGINGPR